jgi:hypothetical protein
VGSGASPIVIVVRLKGRLGNQMFQYAAGRALALRLGVDVALDNRVYEDRGPCALDVFKIVAVEPPRERLPSREKTLVRRWWAERRQQGVLPTKRELWIANRPIFTPWIVNAPDWSYLQGFFQDTRYFADHADTIYGELMPRDPPSPVNQALLERIAGEAFPVSVHVRRGDFVGGRNERPAVYYRGRMEAFAADRPTFFIFSDDPDWCARSLPAGTVVSHNADAPHEDLRLMAACRAHVATPLSSFSMWGGLLQRRR